MKQEKDTYEKLRETLKNQFSGIIEQIKDGDARKEEIEQSLEENKSHLAMGIDGELSYLGVDVQNLSDEEKDSKLSELREKFAAEPNIYGRLSELEAMSEDVKFQQKEIASIEENLNKSVEKSVNSITKYQDSVKSQIKERKSKIRALKKQNKERGDTLNSNEIEQLDLEIKKLEGYLSITENFLEKYGSLEALRKAIAEKEKREEIGYWMDEDKKEYDYFDDMIGTSRRKQKVDKLKTPSKTPSKKASTKKKEEKTTKLDSPNKEEEQAAPAEPPKEKEEQAAPVEPPKEKVEPTTPVEPPKEKEELTAPTEPPKGKGEPIPPTEPPKGKEGPTTPVDNLKYTIKSISCVIENNEPVYYAIIEDENGTPIKISKQAYKGFENYKSLTKEEVDGFKEVGHKKPKNTIDANIYDLLNEIDNKLGTSGVSQYLNMIWKSFRDKQEKAFDIAYDFSELWEKPKNADDKEKLAELRKIAKTCKRNKLASYEKAPNAFKRLWKKLTQKAIPEETTKEKSESREKIVIEEGPREELTPNKVMEHYKEMHDEEGFDIEEFVKNMPEKEADKYRVLYADYRESLKDKSKAEEFKNKLKVSKDKAETEKISSSTKGRSQEEQEKLEDDVIQSIEETRTVDESEKRQEELEKDIIKSIEETR